jgi:Amt family ammonium transporter
MSVLWLALGYSIAFGSGNSFWGGFEKVFLIGVTSETVSGSIPEVLFFTFQMTFAIITPALIVGAYVERINYSFVLIFSSMWMLLVYAPVVHWIWGGGILSEGNLFEIGVFDFAGGIVVHETAGLAALVLAVFLGPRRSKNKPPHNPGMVMIGAAMLWVGWFGFNGGSQLAADGGAAMAITVTHISAATASLSWALWEKLKYGKASLVGIVTGTIAGLASITPASGFVGPIEALIIGFIAGILCQEGTAFIKKKLNIDDTLDVFAVHGLGGIFGTLMIAVLTLVGFENGSSFVSQLGGIFIVGVYTIFVSTLLVLLIRIFVPMRVTEEIETEGLDLSQHGEKAYDLVS